LPFSFPQAKQKCLKIQHLQAKNTQKSIFFHPDFTVGPGVSPGHAAISSSRTLPPVGNCAERSPYPEDVFIVAQHFIFDKTNL